MIEKYLPSTISSVNLCTQIEPVYNCNDNTINQKFIPTPSSINNCQNCRKPFKPSIRDLNQTLWEEIETKHKPEKNLSSETYDCVLHLLSRQHCGQFSAKLVSIPDIIRDTKYLLCGIQSESYVYDNDRQMFTIINEITVDNITPATFHEIIGEFLECGTYFKRLSVKYSNKICTKTDGFVYRTVCLCIQNILNKFHRFVMVYNDDTIMGLLLRVRTEMKQLKMLAKFMGCQYRKQTENDCNEIPRGSELLSYLYRGIIEVTQKDFSSLLVYILQQCVHVYFK